MSALYIFMILSRQFIFESQLFKDPQWAFDCNLLSYTFPVDSS